MIESPLWPSFLGNYDVLLDFSVIWSKISNIEAHQPSDIWDTHRYMALMAPGYLNAFDGSAVLANAGNELDLFSYISFGTVVIKELRLDDSNKELTAGIAYLNAKARHYSERSAAIFPRART
jgi:hypothetical protein